MRNLKRALSLTLASVMLLGMMIVGTSAVSFNDADEISNVTAATVLQELEIMVGDGENFMPDQIVTRGQMAIIVCKLLYGDKLNVSQFEGIKAPAADEGLTRDNVSAMSFNTLTRATPVRFNSILNEYYTVGRLRQHRRAVHRRL